MDEPIEARTHSADEYDYAIPKELIAQHPVANRADARLMIVDRRHQTIDHWHVRDLPELLNPNDCLVLNDTKVVPAKLVGYRTSTRGRWQGLYLDADQSGHLKLLCKTRGRLGPGESITLVDRDGRDDIKLIALARLDRGAWAMRIEGDESADELLRRIGRIPLPHYIRGGNMVDADRTTYQTVYASSEGAVAAPTAGLHFTQELLQRLTQRGVQITPLTLHVGVGTFTPIKSECIEDHAMHSEWGRVDESTVQTIRECRAQGGRVIAIGTTSVRVLESAAKDGDLESWEGDTDLYIHPPFQFNAIDGLMTNFHLPRTSLLVLVRTFGGDALMRRAYDEAIEERYRLFSYGDAMLIL